MRRRSTVRKVSRRSGHYDRDMAFADRLRQARLLAGMTRQGLAEDVGISKSAIDEYEKGRVPPKNLPRLAEALGVSAAWLLTGERTADDQYREILERLDRIERLLLEDDG